MGDIRYDSEISYQVEDHTKKGQQLLKEANENRSTDTYDKAIQVHWLSACLNQTSFILFCVLLCSWIYVPVRYVTNFSPHRLICVFLILILKKSLSDDPMLFNIVVYEYY